MKIITQANAIRAYAGMFRDEPHRTTKNFNALLDLVGKEIFLERHRLEPYYVASYALYRLERLFRMQIIDTKFKAARYQLLMALRRIINKSSPPDSGSKEMAKYCNEMLKVLWDTSNSDKLIEKARDIVIDVTNGVLDRDNIRTVAVTDAIKNYAV